ncbi:MAG: hypothetical protein IKR40_13755 [Treponema sp.]|nr:hypothetical protein [Treponema sp.]
MKAKRFFWNVFLLLVFGAVVFFIGWVSFLVKDGTCCIMTSKTSGVYGGPIKYGEFLWRWERLLPTNVTLTSYKLKDYSYVRSVSGELPSSELYSRQIDPRPDFSYDVTLSLKMSISPEEIYRLASEGKLSGGDVALDEYMDSMSRLASSLIVARMIEREKLVDRETPIFGVLDDNFVRHCVDSRRSDFRGITIDFVEVQSAKIPDIEVYNLAKETFRTCQEETEAALRQRAQEQATNLLEANANMAQLEQFASLLQKYPQLGDLAKTDNFVEIMNRILVQ